MHTLSAGHLSCSHLNLYPSEHSPVLEQTTFIMAELMMKTILIRASAILCGEEGFLVYFLWRVEQDLNLYAQIRYMVGELKKQEEPRRIAFDKGEGREFCLSLMVERTELYVHTGSSLQAGPVF